MMHAGTYPSSTASARDVLRSSSAIVYPSAYRSAEACENSARHVELGKLILTRNG